MSCLETVSRHDALCLGLGSVEVHDVSQRHQRRTGSQSWVCTKNLAKIGSTVPYIMLADKHTDTQTDTVRS